MVDLPLPDRPVKNSTSPTSSGAGISASITAATCVGQLALARDGRRRRRRRRPRSQPRRGSWSSAAAFGSARGERSGHHDGVRQEVGGGQRRPEKAGRRQRAALEAGRPVRRPARAARPCDPGRGRRWLEVSGRQRAGDRHGERVGPVPLAHLRGREVEPAERPELVVAARLDCSDEADAVLGLERVPRPSGAPAGCPRDRRARGRPGRRGGDLGRDDRAGRGRRGRRNPADRRALDGRAARGRPARAGRDSAGRERSPRQYGAAAGPECPQLSASRLAP